MQFSFKVYIILYFSIVFLGTKNKAIAQNSNFVFRPTSAIKDSINWHQFPEFSLPFKVVYGGPRLKDKLRLPLKYGFSHLSTFTDSDYNLPVQNRALLWYGVSRHNDAPWFSLKSPWGNDIESYKTIWTNTFKEFAQMFQDGNGAALPKTDILMLDVESELETDEAILALKKNILIPQKYQTMNNADFLKSYKNDMQFLYRQPIALANSLGNSINLFSSYADVPIRNVEFPTLFINENWQNNFNKIHYNFLDNNLLKAESVFDQQLSFKAPTSYFCAEYQIPELKYSNIAYSMFQVEVNLSVKKDDLMVFEWLKFNKCQPNSLIKSHEYIPNYLAEAQAIFPFFSGAKGIWLWDDPTPFSPSQNLSSYEYFVNGLYKLSEHKDFFTGNYSLIKNISAYEYFKNPQAIWRGVVKNNQILIAAINEFTEDNQTSTLNISHGDWSKTITLKGKNVFLEKFDMPPILANEKEILKDLDLKDFLSKNKKTTCTIFSTMGKKMGKNLFINSNFTTVNNYLQSFGKGQYIVLFEGNKSFIKQKIAIN
ncbi:MAG: hypothetical protein KA313_08380 [Pseudarcicella sp.]|nr:hypothetical protein [Pseudarcicella sp.]